MRKIISGTSALALLTIGVGLLGDTSSAIAQMRPALYTYPGYVGRPGQLQGLAPVIGGLVGGMIGGAIQQGMINQAYGRPRYPTIGYSRPVIRYAYPRQVVRWPQTTRAYLQPVSYQQPYQKQIPPKYDGDEAVDIVTRWWDDRFAGGYKIKTNEAREGRDALLRRQGLSAGAGLLCSFIPGAGKWVCKGIKTPVALNWPK